MTTRRFGYLFRDPSEKSQQIVQQDELALSPSYTRSYGFVMSHGSGAEAWDVDGNRYVDFMAGIAVLSTGHSHPRVVDAVKKQAEQFLHVGGTDFFYSQQVDLPKKLQRIIPINGASEPGDKLTYLCNSGAEAVESAIKLARYHTQRPYIIGFYGGFHGRTMGALSITASKAIQREGYPYLPGGVEHVPYPSRFDCMHNDGTRPHAMCDPVSYIEEVIFKRKLPADEVAAVLVEPIQGEGGYVLPTDDFLPKLRALCDKYGILLITDEIQSGIGRTGKWCAIEHWDVEPDIVCLAKGLGSGMPIGAIMAHRDVMGGWKSGAQASTYGGNPVACAAASTTLDVIEEESLLQHVTQLGEVALTRLQALKDEYPSYVRRVEGLGFMIGMEFAAPDGRPLPALRNSLVEQCFVNGLLTLGCGESTLRIAPPLVIDEALLDEGLSIVEKSLPAAIEEVQKSDA